jgi:hypothetical protein
MRALIGRVALIRLRRCVIVAGKQWITVAGQL